MHPKNIKKKKSEILTNLNFWLKSYQTKIWLKNGKQNYI